MATQDKKEDKDLDEIIVEINGKVHKNWQSYEIDSDFLTPADAFSFNIGLPAGTQAPDLDEGALCTVKVGGELVLTGISSTAKHHLNKTAHTFSINGRDKAGILVDCSAPQINYKGLDLLGAIQKIANPLGIDKIELRAEKGIKFDKVDIEPGMTAWDAIISLANSAGLHAWFDPDGTLIIGGADYTTPPVAVLICNRDGKGNNVIDIDLEKSSDHRFSEITFLGQSHGKGDEDTAKHKLKWVYRDESAKFHKPKTIVLSDVENLDSLKKNAMKTISDMRLEALTLVLVVKGHHTDDDVLYKNGQRVHVISDVFGIDAIFFVMGRRFRLSRSDGKTTTLTCKEDGIWTPDAYPKAKRKRKKGKGGGSNLAVITVKPDEV